MGQNISLLVVVFELLIENDPQFNLFLSPPPVHVWSNTYKLPLRENNTHSQWIKLWTETLAQLHFWTATHIMHVHWIRSTGLPFGQSWINGWQLWCQFPQKRITELLPYWPLQLHWITNSRVIVQNFIETGYRESSSVSIPLRATRVSSSAVAYLG